MNQLMFFVGSWVLLAGIVAVLAMYRKVISREDDSLHLGEFDEPLAIKQQTLARELHWVDRWGKTLTVAALVYGAGLACLFLYRVWAQGGALTPQ